MYFLEKCSYPKCKRSGSVALSEGDKFCNLHRENREEEQEKVEENEDDKKKGDQQ